MTYKCEICCKYISEKSPDIMKSQETFDTGCESFENYWEYRHKDCIEKEKAKRPIPLVDWNGKPLSFPQT